MLNPEELAELRRNARRCFDRSPEEKCDAICVDGPLEGHRFRVAISIHRGPSWIIGWCTPTLRGPIVAYYARDRVTNEWRFLEWSQPGGRASGMGFDGRIEKSPP